MKPYMHSIEELIKKMGYGSIFLKPLAQSRFAWSFKFGAYPLARCRVWLWERRPGSKEQIEKMDQAAARNLSFKPGLSPEQQAKIIRKASHLYRVHWEAIQLLGLTRSRKRLIAMYLDGTQHHIKQPVALHLTTLDKGQVTQPWQGEGILASNGHGKWEPGVMTANRRQKWAQRYDRSVEHHRYAWLRPYHPGGSNAYKEARGAFSRQLRRYACVACFLGGKPVLRILLTEGSSLSARQTLSALGPLKHQIDVLDPHPLFCIARHSRFVRRCTHVPSFGRDPWGYYEAA